MKKKYELLFSVFSIHLIKGDVDCKYFDKGSVTKLHRSLERVYYWHSVHYLQIAKSIGRMVSDFMSIRFYYVSLIVNTDFGEAPFLWYIVTQASFRKEGNIRKLKIIFFESFQKTKITLKYISENYYFTLNMMISMKNKELQQKFSAKSESS